VTVEDQQVGQVRARQIERRRVRHEHGGEQEWLLVNAASTRGDYDDRREKHDRIVEVQDRGHDRHEYHARREQSYG
jgi:hypothetical protein